MKWDIDPDLSLQSRLNFGRWVAPVVALTIVVQIVVLLVPASREVMAKGLGLLALAALTMAGPYAAVHVLSLEGDARLDLQRLSGRSDVRLAAVLLAGSIWPLVAFALPGLIPLLNGAIGPRRVAAIVLGGVASGALMLAAPRAARMDSWLLLALSGIISGLVIGGLVYRPAGALTAVVVSLLCTSAAYPIILRRLRRSPVFIERRRRNLFRGVVRLSVTRLPEFSRALLTAGATGAQPLLLAAAAPVVMVFLQTTPAMFRDVFQALLIYAPLALAGFQCSASARAETTPGGFDLIRLGAGRPWVVVLQIGAGFALPYVAVSAAAALTLLLIRPGEALTILWPWPAAAVLFSGIGMAEGFGRRRLGVYLASVTPVVVLGARTQPEMAAMMLVALWIPIAVAAGRLKNAQAPPLRGVTAVAAAAAIGAIPVFYLHHASMPLALVAGGTSLAAGSFVPDRGPGGGPRLRAACAFAAAVGAGVAEFFFIGLPGSYDKSGSWPHWWLNDPPFSAAALFALICALYAAAGLQFGWLAHNLFGASKVRSRIARGLPLLATFGLELAMEIDGVAALMTAAVPRGGWSTFFVNELAPLSRFLIADLALLSVAVIAVAALSTLEYRRVRGGHTPIGGGT